MDGSFICPIRRLLWMKTAGNATMFFKKISACFAGAPGRKSAWRLTRVP
jgi:hypothetical protein